MSNTTIKIPISNHIVRKYGRCVACGQFRTLKEYKGFYYCAECLEDEDKLDVILEYYTDFSGLDPLVSEKNGVI